MTKIFRYVILLSAVACVRRPPEDNLSLQLEAEVQALRDKNSLLEGRLAQCKDEITGISPDLARELYQVYAGGEILVERRDNLTFVILPSPLLFPADSLSLRQEALPMLDLLATALKLHPDQRVWVVGHADGAPTPKALLKQYPTALDWSSAQAAAVTRALVKEFELDARRFVVAGRGDASPLSTEDSEEARVRNRRVEIVFGAALP